MDKNKLAAAGVLAALLLFVAYSAGTGAASKSAFNKGRLDGCNALALKASGGILQCVLKDGKLVAFAQGQELGPID